MSLSLPVAIDDREAEIHRRLIKADNTALKRNVLNFLGDGGIVLTSPDGSFFQIIVDDAGVLSTAVTELSPAGTLRDGRHGLERQ